MPPKRKRKTQVGSYPRKKKDQPPPKQNQEEETQQEQEEEVMKRTPSCSSSDHEDDDDVCLISPPNFKNNTNNTPITNISPSGRKKGRRGRQISTQTNKDIDSVKSTMNVLVHPFDAHKSDLPKQEAVFQKLGLFDFANLEFDLEARLDLLAELVMTYDPGSHASFVRNMRIRVSRADLAKALRIPYKKEKNSVAVDVPNFKGPPGYVIGNCSAEGMRAVLKFVSARVLPCDDPSLTWDEMVGVVESALKLEQNVDWASLIWSRAEAEIRQGKGLGKFYYGCHFMQLIRCQKPGLLERDLAETENEEAVVQRTRSLEDLDGGELGVEGNQEEGLNEKGDNGGTEEKYVNGEEQKDINEEEQQKDVNGEEQKDINEEEEQKDVNGEEQKDINEEEVQKDLSGVVVEQQEEENNEDENEIMRDDGSEKHGDGVLIVESTIRPCSTGVAEKNEDDEGDKDIEEVQSESEKVDGPMEVDSQGAHLEGLTEAENNALSVLGRGDVTNLDDACLDNPKSSPENLLQGFENGGIVASDTHLEEPIEEEAQFMERGKNILTSTTHIEKPASADEMMTEIVKGVALSADGLLPRSTTAAEHMMMAEIEKDMVLGSEMDLQKPADNVFLVMSQGASHSDTLRKRDMEEENELHGDTGKKPRTDVSSSFEVCMGNLYEWARRAEATYVNEKEMLINRANMEMEQLTQQLQQRDYLIRNLQMAKQEDQHRAIEVNKLKSECFVMNKTFFGYVKAVEDARDTIHQLREIIRQQNGTIEYLNGQLQHQKQNFMAEYQHVKEQSSQLSNHMQETFEKLKTDVDKRMEQQASLEEKLELLKEEMQKKHSDPPA